MAGNTMEPLSNRWARRRSTRELPRWRHVEASPDLGELLVGESEATRQLRARVERLAAMDRERGGATTVLITGETGTGKGLVARTIHDLSPRADRHFVDVNCAAIPSSLLASELFGYEPGAYTDARVAKPGLIELSDGGALFLDEIGAMPPELQVMLLKVLEERSVRRLGGLHPVGVDLRVIAATNVDLGEAASAGRFRSDLFYRLEVLTLTIPPLRERPEDILPLSRHFLTLAARRYGILKCLAPDAEARLLRHPWAGNVRELANVIERVVLLLDADEIRAEDLGLGPSSLSTGAESLGSEPSHRPAGAVDVHLDTVRVDLSQGGVSLEAVEHALLVEALKVAGGNRRRAAELLRITPDTFRYRMAKHGLLRRRR
jgi:DNA-binding NtrC family response regulator